MSSQPRPFHMAEAVSGLADLMDQDELREIPLNLIDPDPEQPRKTWDTAEAQAEYEATRDSIRDQGVRIPVTVRPSANRFVLISGETRFRACRELERATIPAVVRQRIELRQVRIDQLLENVRRNALNPLDLANALNERLDDGMSREDLQNALGHTEQWLSKRLSVLKLPPDVQALARSGQIRDVDTLSALSRLPENERAEHIAKLERGELDGADVRDTARKKKKKKRLVGDANIRKLQSRMQEYYGAKVHLEHNAKTNKGKVTFTYFSMDEFDGLLEKWQFPKDEGAGE